MTELSPEQEASLMKKLSALKKRKASSVRLGIPFSNNRFNCTCNAGTVKISIRYDGNVYPCEVFKNDEPAGLVSARPDNIYSRRLIDIYRDSEYLNEIRELIRRFKDQKHCETCANRYFSGEGV